LANGRELNVSASRLERDPATSELLVYAGERCVATVSSAPGGWEQVWKTASRVTASTRRPQRRRLVTVSLEQIEEERVVWLWRGRVALGKVHVLDGDPGLGKSTLVLDLGARLSRGGELPDGQVTIPRRVLILSGEDDIKDTIKPRLRAAGADMRNIFVLKLRYDDDGRLIPFTVPDDLPLLERALRERRVEFVLIDPMMGFLSDHIHSHNDASVRNALGPLAQVAASHRCAIVCIRHLNKDQRQKNPLYRGGGSIGIGGQARVVLLVGKLPDTGEHDPLRVLAVTKNNLIRKLHAPSLKFELEEWDDDLDIPIVKWHGEVPISAEDLLRGGDARRDDSVRRDVARMAATVLEGGPMPSKELKQELLDAGCADTTIKRALNDPTIFHKYRIRDAAGKTMGWYTHLAEQECPPECDCAKRIILR